VKRNPVKQIMSEIHKEARAGKLDLTGHSGFFDEVKRRVRAAGLPEDAIQDAATSRVRSQTDGEGEGTSGHTGPDD
jgi:hypothetical protein